MDLDIGIEFLWLDGVVGGEGEVVVWFGCYLFENGMICMFCVVFLGLGVIVGGKWVVGIRVGVLWVVVVKFFISDFD